MKRRPLIRLYGLVMNYRWRFAALILTGILSGLVGGAYVLVTKEIVTILGDTQRIPDTGIFRYVRMDSPYNAFLFLIGCALASTFFKCLGMYLETYLGYRVIQQVVMDLRNNILAHVLRMDHAFFQKKRLGDIFTRMTSDLFSLSHAISLAASLITKPFEVIFPLATVVYLDWRLVLLGLVAMPLGGVVYALVSKRLKRFARQATEKSADISSQLFQLIGGIRIIKAFNSEEFEKRRFAAEARQFYDVSMRAGKMVALVRPINEFVAVSGSLAVLGIGGSWVYSGHMEFGTLFAFFTALALMYGPVKDLARMNSDLLGVLPGAERVFAVLDTTSDIVEGQDRVTPADHTFVLKDVNFAYVPEAPVLANLNLVIPDGKVTALIGRTGSGKSTLADILIRFQDPDSGSVSLGGVNLTDMSFSALRRRIALVNQDPFLFNSTIHENISYGDEHPDMEKVMRAAEAANIHDDIMAMPLKYETLVGDRGGNLSGGQRQRVAIARAIYKDSPVLILDEATSSLDAESERKLQMALDELFKNRTCLVIAHRLATIRRADQIAMLDDGGISDVGSHDELMARNEVYASLVSLQNLTGGEAANA